MDDRGIMVRFPAKARDRFSSPKCPDRLRSSPVLCIEWEVGWTAEPVKGVVFPEVRRPGHGANQLLSCTAEAKNACCMPHHPIFLRVVSLLEVTD